MTIQESEEVTMTSDRVPVTLNPSETQRRAAIESLRRLFSEYVWGGLSGTDMDEFSERFVDAIIGACRISEPEAPPAPSLPTPVPGVSRWLVRDEAGEMVAYSLPNGDWYLTVVNDFTDDEWVRDHFVRALTSDAEVQSLLEGGK